MNEHKLLKRLADLPREIEPEHDPWQRIAARLDERPAVTPESTSPGTTASPWRAWRFGAVAATAFLALAIMLFSGPGGIAPEPPALSATSGPEADRPSMPVVLAGSEFEYQAAFREFVPVGDSRKRIPAQTVEQIETGWAELRQIEIALADALALNPDDPFLSKRMLELRARQLGFLRQLAALDHSNRRLTI